MIFRRVLGLVAASSIVGLTACGESGGDEVAQSGDTSAMDTGTGGTTDAVGSDPNASGPANTTTTSGTPTNGPEGTDGTEPAVAPNPGFCPDEQPEVGAECMVGFPAACTYADVGCVCGDGVWDCYSASDCPAAAPEDGAGCDLNGMACTYDDLNCSCDTTDGWSCTSPCPEAQPGDDVSCRRSPNQGCDYAAGVLAVGFMSMADTSCACADGTFVCFTDANCPADAPATGASCEFPTLDCAYEASDCECNADGTWECLTDCPAAFPDDGASCERPEQAVCRYDDAGGLVQGGMGMGGAAASTCACSDLTFTCIGQEDCPTDAPSTGAECADLGGLACGYEGSNCTCGDTGWTCQTECPAAPPADGVSCERNENQPCRYTEGELLAGGGGGFGGGGGALADTSCTCAENAFDCFTPADCPTALPAADEACTVSRVLCVVEGQNCTCNGQTDTWTCNMPPDPDAGVDPGTEGMDSETSGAETTDVVSSEAPSTSQEPLDAGAP